MKYTLIFKVLFLFCITNIACARDIDHSKYSMPLRSFIEEVVYQVQAGDIDKEFKKLRPSVTLSVYGAPKYVDIVNTKLKDFLAVTGVKVVEKVTPAKSSEVKSKQKETSNIKVYINTTIANRLKAAEINKQIQFSNEATHWKWWDKRTSFINNAVIFISTDKYKDKELEDVLVEKMLGVFGLPAQSGRADNSCLSEKEGIYPSLQPLDKAVLKFLYESVPAGTKPHELRKIIREKWPKK